MNCFILGFQRLVWCPKWTPASNSSLMPILSTVFPLVISSPTHAGEPSRGTRDYVWCCYGPLRSHKPRHLRPFSQSGRGFRKPGPTQTEQHHSKEPAPGNIYFSHSLPVSTPEPVEFDQPR